MTKLKVETVKARLEEAQAQLAFINKCNDILYDLKLSRGEKIALIRELRSDTDEEMESTEQWIKRLASYGGLIDARNLKLRIKRYKKRLAMC